ncbi:DMT family protein [Bdellovibrio sp. HCB117]|uniref:DMT family protein n=1 Tax=Bdellovibrio sp. HCB117 TaxID=3394359 RepID=UPI0039B53C9B
MSQAVLPISLLVLSNVFMTFAWYGHLKSFKESALWVAILVSWGIAFFEYLLQVPANRIGYTQFTLPQLKIIQEVITMVVFAGFSVLYMKQSLKLDFLWAGLCLIGAVYFIFRSP